jgi:hypothetical protein
MTSGNVGQDGILSTDCQSAQPGAAQPDFLTHPLCRASAASRDRKGAESRSGTGLLACQPEPRSQLQ